MNIIIMGSQGSGKGTQAKLISNRYNIPHISTGDIFREAAEQKTEMGLKAKSYWGKGNLVPDEITDRVVKERISMKDCKKGFILDGYPRNISQAESLDKIVKIDFVLELYISQNVIIERLSARQQCRKCNITYGLDRKPKKPGVCDNCNGELFQRDDEKPEAIRKRLEIYHTQTKPVLEIYEKRGILYRINGNRLVKDVFADIQKVLEKSKR